jgi:AraC-like DNA-binding protein
VAHNTNSEPETLVAEIALPCGRFDALWADHFAMRYPPHFHETWAIGVVQSGLVQLRTARGEWIGGPGTILAFAPGEIHSAAALSPDGYRYRMVYPTAELIRGISQHDRADASDRPFEIPVFTDHDLAEKLVTAHQPLMDGHRGTDAESRLVSALRSLWRNHQSARSSAEGHAAVDLRAVECARDYLGARFAKQVRLASVAAECGMSSFQLIRVFQRVLGVSPYAYLVQLRVNRARDLLHQGIGVSEVAYSCGFSDQSHLTRVFKKAIGVPPGTYQRAVRERAA